MNIKRLIVVLIFIMALLLAACSQEEPTPAIPTLAPTAEIPEVPTDTPVPAEESEPADEAGSAEATEPAAPIAAGDAWERIQISGKMVVGTSADYPPFEYYTPDFQLDGLDMAIIREIGDRLGLEIEIKDFAFEGLGAALDAGQIDAAIAGISITPERLGTHDFSNIYFTSEDAYLAREGEEIAITYVEDLLPYRIGVQSGTVYQDWLQESLVDSGLLSPEKLIAYVDTEAMVADLDTGFVDVLVADRQPAEVVTAEGPYQIVGNGLQQQLFAIAMSQGVRPLQEALNGALADMQNDGTLLEFIEKYLGTGVAGTLPPDFELPEAIEPDPADCVDAMAYVADLNLDDQNMTAPPPIEPGEPFQKGWRIQNAGTCDWGIGYQMIYVDGNVPAAQMGGEPTPVLSVVSPGQEYDMMVDLVAPVIPGIYQGFWQMTNVQGVPFGQRLWVGISVTAGPAPTPDLGQPPSADFQFSVDPTSIQQGQCAVLTWQVSEDHTVFVYEQGQPWQNYGVPASGQRTVCPATTTVYEMGIVRPDNTIEVRQTAVSVVPVAGAPIITRFSAEPNTVALGQCVNLQWQVDGSVQQVRIFSDSGNVLSNASISGSAVDCPTGAGQITYLIEAQGPGGTSSQARYVQVVSQPQPTATPAAKPPVVNYFSVSPNKIKVNECVTISWGASGGTTKVQIKRNGKTILDNAPHQGNATDCRKKAGTYKYSIVARNSANQRVTKEQSVKVSNSNPQIPLAGTNWQLTRLQGKKVNQIPTVTTASFTKGGSIKGSGGCNSYSGSYSQDGKFLSISGLSSGSKSCGKEIDALEQAYLSRLKSAVRFRIKGNNLTLFDSRGRELLVFKGL